MHWSSRGCDINFSRSIASAANCIAGGAMKWILFLLALAALFYCVVILTRDYEDDDDAKHEKRNV